MGMRILLLLFSRNEKNLENKEDEKKENGSLQLVNGERMAKG